MRGLYERLLRDFMVSDFDFADAYETAEHFFGRDRVRFAGIDGTMYSRSLFDLMIFFGGAYAATGTVEFSRKESPRIEYDSQFLECGAGVSSVVPMYISEVPDLDQAFFDVEETGALPASQPLVDETIINNATIANWIMSFAEYYLAYKLITEQERPVQILLMDRTLSGERASLLGDTSKRELWETKGSLIGFEVDGTPIDVNDLAYGRYCLRNPSLGLPPARADYLRYAVIYLVEEEGPLSGEEICEALDIMSEAQVERVRSYLKTAVEEKLLLKRDSHYLINPRYRDSWDRLKSLVRLLGDRFFDEAGTEGLDANKMKIVKAGEEHWLTTLDLAFLTLFCLQMIIEECWRRRVLFLGLTKDTAARDFKRQLIPLMQSEGRLQRALTAEEFEELPNTDRMILQSVSLFNPEQVQVPWSLIEYDSAFKTMIPGRQGRKGHVLGARRNRIGLEKTFLKTYIQLSQASTDPRLRSNVLLTDRLVYPEFDYSPENLIRFWNQFGSAQEPMEAILYQDRTVRNPLQNLIMILLKAMTNPSIPEAFGHNYPLFAADKVAKWHYSSFKRVAESTGKWILNNHKLRRFIFYMSTFRERRARIEATRREIL